MDKRDRRWDTVAAALDAVLAAAPVDRPRSLAGLPDDIRDEVAGLLEAHDRAGSFLDDAIPAASRLEVGDRLGAWRILAPIGRGGMGAVYRAARDDGQFEMAAAIKVVAGTALSPDMARRFRDERQILASLEHPNIARLLDGGVDAAGRPYLVMELVDGAPITEYLRDQPRHVRLACFRDVAAAVQFAHQRLIVHRDIKPANILVTPAGVVKLVDFGIAHPLTEAGGPMSIAAATPDYASPEQLRGGTVSTAADVWSLGALLYEIVSGRPPFALARASIDDILRIVTTTMPAPLDDDDLSAIARRALAADPAQRYASPAELSRDVDRVLRHEPVEARPASWTYVVKKYVRRHRLGVAMGALAAAAVVTAGGVAIWQARTADAARRIAERRLADIRELAGTLIFGVDDRMAPLPGSSEARRFFVARGLAYLDRLLADGEPDPPLARQMVSGYLRLGEILGRPGSFNLGDTAGALAAFAKAEALAQAATDRAGASAALEDRRRLAAVQGRISEVYLSERRPEAVDRAVRAVAVFDGVTPADDDVETWLAIAAARFMLASSRQALTPDAAVADWRATLAIYERLRARDPGRDEFQRNAALVHKNLASYFLSRDRSAARPHLEAAIAIDGARLGRAPDNPHVRLDYSFSLTQAADVFAADGDWAAAALRYRQAVDVRQALTEADPADVRARGRLVYAQVRLARATAQLGDRRAASDVYLAAIGHADRLLAASPEQINTVADRIAAWAGLAAVTGECAYHRRAEAALAELGSRAPSWVVSWVRDRGRERPCPADAAPR